MKLFGRTMRIRPRGFNIILAMLLAVAFSACETTSGGSGKKGKEAATLKFHLQSWREVPERTLVASVYRDNPISVIVEKEPALFEAHIENVEIIDAPDGFRIQVRLNREGTLILQNLTTGDRGKRLVIVSLFTEVRYLAAPVLSRVISDGLIIFRPDATRAEAERIVRGVNNLIREARR